VGGLKARGGGTYLVPGTEVCNTYKYMPNNNVMLQYGLLQVVCVWSGPGGGPGGEGCGGGGGAAGNAVRKETGV
jgi:hypothetical protein